ncbi:hypothetical protein PF008_g14865 [Phytophthora fragariae]|uniref:Uncharacterized protein n=2 Tax=Phytophthora fragariae TaxID=53985 RepID=A0A6G0RFV0_9STRA|nr:hypothetical protein PF008_g14865 [Phytophthora fragariae]
MVSAVEETWVVSRRYSAAQLRTFVTLEREPYRDVQGAFRGGAVPFRLNEMTLLEARPDNVTTLMTIDELVGGYADSTDEEYDFRHRDDNTPNGALANTNWTINKVLITNIQQYPPQGNTTSNVGAAIDYVLARLYSFIRCFLLFVFVGAPTNIVAVQATTAARRKSCHAGLVLQMAILLDW